MFSKTKTLSFTVSCRINEKARVAAFSTISKYEPSFSFMDASSKFLYLMTTREPNRTDVCAMKRVLVFRRFSLLQLLASDLFLSFQISRSIRFSLVGFNGFLFSYRFILFAVYSS